LDRSKVGKRIEDSHTPRKLCLFGAVELRVNLDCAIGQTRQELDLNATQTCRRRAPRQLSLNHADEHFILVGPCR
jgi:hypothetical protein